MAAPSLDGRVFVDATPSPAGDVSAATRFHYSQSGSEVWATYAGGAIVRGYLVGTRSADSLAFRYVHLCVDGSTAAGRCATVIEAVGDGRVRLHETWTWESRSGSGTSVLEEAGSA